MRLRPGSVAWLLRHELRLAWRAAAQGSRGWLLFGLGGLLWAAYHVAVWGLLQGGRPLTLVGPFAGFAVWFLFTLMVSLAISQSVSALFERGDLDLLLSSPLPPRRVLMVRGLGVALSAGLLTFLALAPFAHVGLFTGQPRLLAVYPALVGLVLLATAIGLASTLALVRWIGARRARTVAQVLGALVGAGIFLASQAQGLLPDALRARLFAWVMSQMAPGGLLAPDAALWLPARALGGEPGALLAVCLGGTLAFIAVSRGAHRRFLAGTQESLTGAARPAARASALRFRSGLWRVVLTKEWRLILRDPHLITQTLMPVLFLLPMVFLVGRDGQGLPTVVSGTVFAACTLASSLAWLTVSAEDAPELLGMAPRSLERLQWIKLLAALLPIWLLCLPLLAFLLPGDPWLAVVFLLTLAGGTGAVGVAQVWFPRPGSRLDMKGRGKRHQLLGLVDFGVTFAWGLAAWGAGTDQPAVAGAGLAIGLMGPAAVWVAGRRRRAG